MEAKPTIHIGLCADEKFAMPLGVCLTSVFESNRSNALCVHVIGKDLSEQNKAFLDKLSEKYCQKINVYNISDNIFDNLPISDLFPKSIYYRYLFADFLPSEIDKILYLDCDTIVLNDLTQLYLTDISEYPLAAAEDRNGDDILERNRIEIFDGVYFNSGVLLLNLKFWRENDSINKLCSFIRENPRKCLWPDQDALNILYHNNVLILPTKYNFLISYVGPLEDLRLHKNKWLGIVEASTNIVVLHFATKDKPWYKYVKHPLANIWRHYYRLSPWCNVKLKDPRKISEKLIDFYKYSILKWNRYNVSPQMSDVINILNDKIIDM